MDCINCDKELQEVFSGSGNYHKYKDALDVEIHLGYGEFRDHGSDEEESIRAHLCKACTNQLILAFPGFRKMLDI